MRRFLGLIVAIVFASCSALAAQPVAGPTPAPVLRVIPVAPTNAPAATPTPNRGTLVRYAGQLLDVEKGFVFFTSGDGFRIDPQAKILDADGKPLTQTPRARMYASASFDRSSGNIVELDVSKTPIKQSADYDPERAYLQAHSFAVTESTPAPNQELASGGAGMTGRPVAVTFVVQVPVATALTDSVYISTDVSNWDPKAILMVRIDALHFRATTNFPSGTIFHYKYTRGTFRTIEVGRTGLDEPPRTVTVGESDALRRDDIVYHWQDESLGTGGQTIGPGSVPTPFNPNSILNLPTPPPGFGPGPVTTYPPGYGPTGTGPRKTGG